MKWVGIFQIKIFRGDFRRGSLMGGNLSGWNFPRQGGTEILTGNRVLLLRVIILTSDEFVLVALISRW